MKIDREVVLNIAKLARIELTEQEVRLFAGQLQQILEYIEKLQEIKQPAEPFSFGDALPTVTRADETEQCFSQEEALQNAPERIQNFFKVPRIIP